MRTCRYSVLLVTLSCIFFGYASRAQTVLTIGEKDAFAIVSGGQAAVIRIDNNEYAGVKRAVANFAEDVLHVTDVKPAIVSEAAVQGLIIIAGTLGKNALIDELIKNKKINR